MRFPNSVLGVVGLAMVALTGQPMKAALAADTVKIGAVLSLTGGAATLGDPESKTLSMLVDDANKAGGLLGRRIELIQYDDGSEPGKANGLIKRLLNDDQVDMLIGGSTTGASMAMYPAIEKAEIPFISLAGATVISEPVKKWMFKVSHQDRMVGEKVMGDMKAKGITSFGMLSDTSGYGQSARKEMHAVAQRMGLTIAVDETFNTKDTDVTAQLAKMKGDPAVKAIFVVSFGQGAVVATKNIAQLGITLPHYQAHGSASHEYIRLSGASAEGVRLPAPALMVASELPDGDPQKQISLDYAAAYQARYGAEPSPFGAYARDAFFLWADAVKRAGGFDKAKVRDAIEGTRNLAGTCGVVNMSAEDHLGLDASAFKLVTVRNGAFTLAE